MITAVLLCGAGGGIATAATIQDHARYGPYASEQQCTAEESTNLRAYSNVGVAAQVDCRVGADGKWYAVVVY